MLVKIELENLRVVVTAGAQGIGRAIVEAFLESGAQVHVCDIDQTALSQLGEDLPMVGRSLADVSNPDQVDTFIDDAISEMGGVDVLINNAGISGPAGAVETLETEAWRKTMEVNVNGQFYCARRVIPQMKAQGSGAIVNIASTAGLFGYAFRSPYATSKWAVIGFTKTLAMELGEHGIRVNAVCPGSINNARMDGVIAMEARASVRDAEKIREQYTNQVSMRTFIDPEEIAAMVTFICSPQGSKISGQALSVDGHTETLRT